MAVMSIGDIVAYCAMTDFFRPAEVVAVEPDGLTLRVYNGGLEPTDRMAGDYWTVAGVAEGDGIGEWLPKEEVWPTN